MDTDIFKNFANSFLQNDIVSESSRQPPDVSKNIDYSFLNSPPQCFEWDTLILSESTSTNIFQQENHVSIDLNKKLNDQLIEIRKYHHQEYISSNCNAVIDDISKDIQIDNNDINKKSNTHGVVDSVSPKAKTKDWPRGTCLVTGDSTLRFIDEARMLRKFNVKVRSFHGAKTDDMFQYLVQLLEKNPDYVMLHDGTNDAVDHQSNNII